MEDIVLETVAIQMGKSQLHQGLWVLTRQLFKDFFLHSCKRGACPWKPSGTREGSPGMIYMAFEHERKVL